MYNFSLFFRQYFPIICDTFEDLSPSDNVFKYKNQEMNLIDFVKTEMIKLKEEKYYKNKINNLSFERKYFYSQINRHSPHVKYHKNEKELEQFFEELRRYDFINFLNIYIKFVDLVKEGRKEEIKTIYEDYKENQLTKYILKEKSIYLENHFDEMKIIKESHHLSIKQYFFINFEEKSINPINFFLSLIYIYFDVSPLESQKEIISKNFLKNYYRLNSEYDLMIIKDKRINNPETILDKDIMLFNIRNILSEKEIKKMFYKDFFKDFKTGLNKVFLRKMEKEKKEKELITLPESLDKFSLLVLEKEIKKKKWKSNKIKLFMKLFVSKYYRIYMNERHQTHKYNSSLLFLFNLIYNYIKKEKIVVSKELKNYIIECVKNTPILLKTKLLKSTNKSIDKIYINHKNTSIATLILCVNLKFQKKSKKSKQILKSILYRYTNPNVFSEQSYLNNMLNDVDLYLDYYDIREEKDKTKAYIRKYLDDNFVLFN